ncbi:XRE family transcriptional regulator [Paenibacillus glycanilyticus]|uniref:Peptidase S24/S26A/S26B/S26C domain-containing protein n=1 Tax=Paenibacillus glycanilyticus TaxID=126569 RepID=A0ABQ6GGZ2_9BACL|nr:XRE family transcriptional regulator [Paenibacillus glycanilyticus]GLX68317.1 hypothetical protein MU1_26620 [Paenibacillus glycanilyticus]
MGYHEMLIEMVENSKLTLKEIADKCGSFGVKINPSYISKLQTTKQAVASDEVNIAIARVCNGDIEQFRYEAYLAKAPDLIKDFIIKIISMYKQTTLISMQAQNVPEEYMQQYLEQLNNMHDLDFIKDFEGLELNEGLEENLTLIHKIEDDSMEPRIPKGSICNVDPNGMINSGDMVVAMYANEVVIRRYILFNDMVVLLSENNKYPPIQANVNEIKVLAKIASLTIPL